MVNFARFATLYSVFKVHNHRTGWVSQEDGDGRATWTSTDSCPLLDPLGPTRDLAGSEICTPAPADFSIVNLPIHHANQIVPRIMLFTVGWDEPLTRWDLRPHIHRIRLAIEPDSHHPQWLATRREEGYLPHLESWSQHARDFEVQESCFSLAHR